jgi:hypothetical protein
MRLIDTMFKDVPHEETVKMVAQNAIDYFHLDGVAVTPKTAREAAAAR